MAITITGGKYAAASVSSVGTTTVTVSTTPFVSGDFASPRRADLYNSTGTTYKGSAFVRKYNSSSQLQLETEFLDFKTGNPVTQVSGDTVIVSKNWSDVVQTGIAISNGTVTISDTLTFGTADDIDSVCFHDEDLNLVFTATGYYSRNFDVAGGMVTLGHLQNWETRAIYSPCNMYFANTQSINSFAATSTAARLCMFGGVHKGGGQPLYTTGGFNGAGYGSDWGHLWLYRVVFSNTDVISKGAGANWSTGSDHILEECSFVGATNNLILLRFGNGSVKGGQFKFPNFTASPISVFGSDANGTYAVGAPAGFRSVVLDIGDSNLLWRCGENRTQTVNITNLVSTSFETASGGTITKNVYFEDIYSNLQNATNIAIIRDSDWTTDDTDTSSGSASSLTMAVFYGGSTATTAAIPTYRGPWTYRIRKYGYDEIEGAIAESAYSLGTAGTATNVEFGGRVNQIARASLTDSEATALAYTGITVTDHGASPVTWNSKAWSITVTVDLATYPSRTAAQVFAHIKAGISKTATWNGKAGLLWHVLMEESGAGYISQRGKSGGAGASLKGVRIIDQAGNPLTDVISMTADDGTEYVPPTLDVRGLTFTGLVSGSTVRVFDTGTQTVVFSTTSSGTSESWSESASGSRTLDYTIYKDGYLPIRVTGVTVTGAVSGGVLSIGVTQDTDRAFSASSGLSYGTTATINTTTKLFTVTAATTGQNWYSFWVEQYRSNSALYNKPFPLQANGPNSFTLKLGYEFSAGLTYITRDGIRYVDSSGATTAQWAALLSIGVPSGLQVRYQQVEGSAPSNAAATGNIDQLIQVYGDSSHGNFDYRGFMVCKVQAEGYDQAEVDVVGQYGNLEDQLYVIALLPTENGVAADNPTVSSVTITDHGASPVTWNTNAFSLTITDSGTTSGEDIMQWIRHAFAAGGTFQGKNGFNWHDLVQTNGIKFKGVRGSIYGDTGAALKGVRVLRGSDAHPDFTLHTADDGSTVSTTPPAQATATILADSRIQLYNVTTDAELDNSFQTGTSYSNTLVSGVSVGDTLRLRVCKLGYEEAESFAVWTASGCAFIVSQSVSDVYTAWGIDGSAITEFSGDVTGHIYIDANDLDGVTTKTRLGAWYSWVLTTEIGIRHFYGGVSYLSTAAIRINVDVADIMIENTNATTALRFTDLDVRLYRSDGTSVIAPTSYSIHNDYSGVPDVVETGVSGLTTAESNQLMALPTSSANSAAVLAAINATTGARTIGEHLQIQTAVLAGAETGAGTTHITFTDGTATVEADVPLPGEVGNRTNVTISV